MTSKNILGTFVGLILALLLGIIIFFNFAYNSQNLPQYDGILYQKNYLYLTSHFVNRSFSHLLGRVLHGEFFHNSLIPFLAYGNYLSGNIFRSYLMLGTLNDVVIFFSCLIISVLAPLVVFEKSSFLRSSFIFLLLLSQKIFWSLGNGFFDLRNDMGPSLVTLMCYLCCLLFLLREKFKPAILLIFVSGMLYLVLSRPPLLAFIFASLFLSFTTLFLYRPLRRGQLVKTSLIIGLTILPLLLTLVPRWPGLKEYYFTMGYEAGQWPQFYEFWRHDVPRVYGIWPVVLWGMTICMFFAAIAFPHKFRKFTALNSRDIVHAALVLVPAIVTFGVLNLQGTYGNPYGYILFMISGGIALPLIFRRNLSGAVLGFVSILVCFSSISNSIKEIKAALTGDKILITEIKKEIRGMDEIAQGEPYSVIFLTVAGTDCTAVNVLNLDQRMFLNIKGLCFDRVHSSDLGMETRLNGRGDVGKLKRSLAKMDWQSLSYIPKQYLDPELLKLPKEKLIFFWNLIEGDPEFGSKTAYLYSHRVADILQSSLIAQGAKKVLSSPALRSDIFSLHTD